MSTSSITRTWVFCQDDGINDPDPVPVAVFTIEALALLYRERWPDRVLFEIEDGVNPIVPDD